MLAERGFPCWGKMHRSGASLPCVASAVSAAGRQNCTHGREDFLSLQLTYCIRHNGEIKSQIRSLLQRHCFPFPCCPTSFCLGFRGKQSSCPGWRGWEDCAATHPRA